MSCREPLTPAPDIEFSDRYLSPAWLQPLGLPVLPYPLALDTPTPSGIEEPWPLAEMLYALQCRIADDERLWRKYEDAMERLIFLLAEDMDKPEVLVQSECWQCLCSEVDLAAPVVTLQRKDEVLLALAPQHPQLLKACVYAPLDRKALQWLTLLCQKPEHQQYHQSRDCFARAADMSSPKMAVAYAAQNGHSYRSKWTHDDGLGISHDGTQVPVFYKQRNLVAKPAAWLAVQIEVYRRFEERTEPAPPPPAYVPPPPPAMVWWLTQKVSSSTLRDRSIACLLGGAIGDAVAACPTPDRPEPGRISSVTQMSLITAEGLIRAITRLLERGNSTLTGVVAMCYRRWAAAQLGTTLQTNLPDCDGWLLGHPVMQQQRATPKALLRALAAEGSPSPIEKPFQHGTGALTRVAAVAAFCLKQWPDEPDKAWHLASDLAGLTHQGAASVSPAAAFALILRGVMENVSLEHVMEISMDFLVGTDANLLTSKAILHAQNQSRYHSHPPFIAPQNGANGVLSAALYHALTATSFEQGVSAAVQHTPPADKHAVTSLTAQLLAAQHGLAALPQPWLDALELREVIGQLGSDLIDCNRWTRDDLFNDSQDSAGKWEQYPGC